MCYNEFGDFMLYTSIDNKKIKDLKKLNTKKYPDREAIFEISSAFINTSKNKQGVGRGSQMQRFL